MFVVSLCEKLHIDDPVTWMQATDPAVVDLWIAKFIMDEQGDTTMRPADEAFNQAFERAS